MCLYFLRNHFLTSWFTAGGLSKRPLPPLSIFDDTSANTVGTFLPVHVFDISCDNFPLANYYRALTSGWFAVDVGFLAIMKSVTLRNLSNNPRFDRFVSSKCLLKLLNSLLKNCSNI